MNRQNKAKLHQLEHGLKLVLLCLMVITVGLPTFFFYVGAIRQYHHDSLTTVDILTFLGAGLLLFCCFWLFERKFYSLYFTSKQVSQAMLLLYYLIRGTLLGLSVTQLALVLILIFLISMAKVS